MDWGIDTSALLRVITEDPPSTAEKVIERIEDIWADGGTVLVSDLVVSEAYFAMQRHYRKTKAEAIAALLVLSRQPGFRFSENAVHALSQPNAATMSPGMVDRMIAGEYRERGLRILACEKNFRRFAEAEVVAE